MPVALALMLADCVSRHLFRLVEAKVRDRLGRKDTGQTTASAVCSAHFEIQLTCAAFSCGCCQALSLSLFKSNSSGDADLGLG